MSDQDVIPAQEPQPVKPPSEPQQPPPAQPQFTPQQAQPEAAFPVQPQYAPQVSQRDMVRALAATKSYYGAALLTLALYWLTFWIGGIIANVIYLNSASNTQRLSGVSPEGKGCLWALLITHIGIPLLIIGLLLLYLLLLSFQGPYYWNQ